MHYHGYSGLMSRELQPHLEDVNLMRIAVRLNSEDIYPLAAGLFGNVGSKIQRIEGEYPELRPCDRAFVIMTEWKKMLAGRNECPSSGKLANVFEEMGINKHTVCMVSFLTCLTFSLPDSSF